LNSFLSKLDDSEEAKMLFCKDCLVSFDRTKAFVIPTSTKALQYVQHETTGHMASLLTESETLLYDEMVAEDKIKLCCWPLKLVKFAMMHIVHAFHAKHVMCGIVDTELGSEKEMPLTTGVEIVLVIGQHKEHYALFEIESQKRKVKIWGCETFEEFADKRQEVLKFWMQCIVLILRRHWSCELEDDASNILLYNQKRTEGKGNKRKKAWRVLHKIVYEEPSIEDSGAIILNQLAWRLNELTHGRASKEVVASVNNPKKLQTENRIKAYELLCFLMQRHKSEQIWNNGKEKRDILSIGKDDGENYMLTCETTKEGSEANDEVEGIAILDVHKGKKNDEPLRKECTQEEEIHEPNTRNQTEIQQAKNGDEEVTVFETGDAMCTTMEIEQAQEKSAMQKDWKLLEKGTEDEAEAEKSYGDNKEDKHKKNDEPLRKECTQEEEFHEPKTRNQTEIQQTKNGDEEVTVFKTGGAMCTTMEIEQAQEKSVMQKDWKLLEKGTEDEAEAEAEAEKPYGDNKEDKHKSTNEDGRVLR
jgi:hypothetical protein